MDLEDKIKKIISEKLGVSLDEVTPSSSLVEDLGASLVEIADLPVSLEQELDINFVYEEKGKIKTVAQVINLISSHVQEL